MSEKIDQLNSKMKENKDMYYYARDLYDWVKKFRDFDFFNEIGKRLESKLDRNLMLKTHLICMFYWKVIEEGWK